MSAFTQLPVHLSCVNRTLHMIWHENTDRIVQAILRPHIPAYDDALALAVAEASSAGSTQAPPRLWLPLLQRNAHLAASAEAHFHKFVAQSPAHHVRHRLSTASFPAPYYLIRRLVMSYLHPELKPATDAEVAAFPSDYLSITFELCSAITLWMWENEEERERQGMPKDEALLTYEEKMEGGANKDEWDYAIDTLWEAMKDRKMLGPPFD